MLWKKSPWVIEGSKTRVKEKVWVRLLALGAFSLDIDDLKKETDDIEGGASCTSVSDTSLR